MRYRFEVTLDIPAVLDRKDVQAYVADAVADMMGCHHPADPILLTKLVTVRGIGLEPVACEVGFTFYDPDYDV